MSRAISLEQFRERALSGDDQWVALIDVRKKPARNASGKTINGAMYRSPFSADQWWPEFEGRRVTVFCVHGHEVSQAVCGFLNDCGLDAAYLEGGYEAWVDAGGATVSIGEDQ